MTKFEALSEAIAKKKKDKNFESDVELEVAGSEATEVPLLSAADDDADMDLTDQLYFKSKHKPLMGEYAEKWD